MELPIQIDQTKIAALLDCGATHNFISSGLVEQLQIRASKGPPLTVTMANTQVIISEKYITAPLQFGPSVRQISFQTLPDLSTLIILGMQFLETINPMVDWVNKTVAWTDNNN